MGDPDEQERHRRCAVPAGEDRDNPQLDGHDGHEQRFAARPAFGALPIHRTTPPGTTSAP
jgi:hypothetical protein